MSDGIKRKFMRLTEAEQAEFLELTKDCIDPELYSEDDLPSLRASRKRWEEEQRREKEAPTPDECDRPCEEDLEIPSDPFDPWQWRGN